MAAPFEVNDGYVSIQAVTAKDLNRRAKVLRFQLGGALRAIGEGVAFDPDTEFDSLLCSASGANISVRQGQGFVSDSNGNVFWFRTEQDVTVSPISGSACYVYAEYIEPDADVANGDIAAVDDTDTTGDVNIIVSASSSLANAIKLADIDASGGITDSRTFIRWDNVGVQIADIVEWLGYTSAIYTAKSSVQTRLLALEGLSGTVISYLSQIAVAADDTRNAADVLLDLETRVGTLENGGSSIKPMQQKTDILTQELAITRQTAIALQPESGERSASSNIEGSVDGVYGDGSDGRSDYLIDSTMTINDDGEFDA